jgi:hypothetical protein
MADDERLVREVEAHRRALAFDVNLCHACGKSWPCLARRLSDRLAASEQEAARLGAALRHYGQHDEACHIARCQYDEQQNVLPGSHCGCGGPRRRDGPGGRAGGAATRGGGVDGQSQASD